MENGPHAVVPRPSVRKKPPARLHLCSQSRPLLSPDRRIPRPLNPHRRTGPNAAHPAPDRPDLREKAGHTPLQASPPQPPPAAAPRLPRPARLEHQRPARAFLPCTGGTASLFPSHPEQHVPAPAGIWHAAGTLCNRGEAVRPVRQKLPAPEKSSKIFS